MVFGTGLREGAAHHCLQIFCESRFSENADERTAQVA